MLKQNKLWKIAVRMKASDTSRAIISAPQGIKFRMRNKRGPIGLDVAAPMGMGAMLTRLVLLLRFADQKKVPIDIRFTNPLYASENGENWLPRYFDVNKIIEDFEGQRFKINNSWDFRMIGVNTFISLADAASIFSRKVRFSDLVEQTFNDFITDANMPKETLGIHFRGTDKAFEAAPVSQEAMLLAIKKSLEQCDIRHIFLATDEPSFQKKMTSTFGSSMITCYEQAGVDLQSDGPIHFSAASGGAKAIDALMNIRLLAQCPHIIRTASYMSGWAKVLNPAQEVIMLNKLSTSSHRFPDTEIATLMQKSGGNFAV